MATAERWLEVCDADEIEAEDVLRFDHGGATFVVYRTPSGYYASDGWCTHERAHLADGFVNGEMIECPRHQGRFHIPSGAAKSPPACIALRTYPVKVEDERVFIGLPA
jgi:3-phenylpropionate/trans-cinnamate dioxygenase ferredoxin subunit